MRKGVRRRSVLKAFLSCITAKDGVGAQSIAELLNGGMTQAEDLKELHSRVIADLAFSGLRAPIQCPQANA